MLCSSNPLYNSSFPFPFLSSSSTFPFLPLCFPTSPPPSLPPLFSWPPSKGLKLLSWVALIIPMGLFKWTGLCNVHRWTCVFCSFVTKVGSVGVQLNPTLTSSWHQLCCPIPSFLPKIVPIVQCDSCHKVTFFFFNSLITARFKLCRELLFKGKEKI